MKKRNERMLKNASILEEIRDITRKILGEDVDVEMIHSIFESMRLNDEMDTTLLEGDLKNAIGLSTQLYGETEGGKTETIVGVYEKCVAKSLEELD